MSFAEPLNYRDVSRPILMRWGRVKHRYRQAHTRARMKMSMTGFFQFLFTKSTYTSMYSKNNYPRYHWTKNNIVRWQIPNDTTTPDLNSYSNCSRIHRPDAALSMRILYIQIGPNPTAHTMHYFTKVNKHVSFQVVPHFFIFIPGPYIFLCEMNRTFHMVIIALYVKSINGCSVDRSVRRLGN